MYSNVLVNYTKNHTTVPTVKPFPDEDDIEMDRPVSYDQRKMLTADEQFRRVSAGHGQGFYCEDSSDFPVHVSEVQLEFVCSQDNCILTLRLENRREVHDTMLLIRLVRGMCGASLFHNTTLKRAYICEFTAWTTIITTTACRCTMRTTLVGHVLLPRQTAFFDNSMAHL